MSIVNLTPGLVERKIKIGKKGASRLVARRRNFTRAAETLPSSPPLSAVRDGNFCQITRSWNASGSSPASHPCAHDLRHPPNFSSRYASVLCWQDAGMYRPWKRGAKWRGKNGSCPCTRADKPTYRPNQGRKITGPAVDRRRWRSRRASGSCTTSCNTVVGILSSLAKMIQRIWGRLAGVPLLCAPRKRYNGQGNQQTKVW